MNSEMMNMRPSGSGARESPRYKTTLGCRASLVLKLARAVEGRREDALHEPPLSLKVFRHIVISRWQNLLDGNIYAEVLA